VGVALPPAGEAERTASPPRKAGSVMTDFLLVAIALLFFAAALAYLVGCERLR
jgi:hypothetical protein